MPAVIANVTLAVLVVTVLSNASWIATFGCVAHATPPVPPLGCCVNPNFTAAPAVTLNVLLIALVSPDARRRQLVAGARLVDRQVGKRHHTTSTR